MSDEQQHQQQLQHKSNKDNSTGAATPSQQPPLPPHQQQQQQQRKTNIHEMRNQEYVSRLMAATPPYLYSAPVGPNNFFFSDMLRSLVQARNNENARNLQLQQSALSRRPRKRSWSQHRPYYEQLRERKETEEKQQIPTPNIASMPSALNAEKPLELTNKPFFQMMANKYRKADESSKEFEEKPLVDAAARKTTDFTEAASTANNATTTIAGGAVDNTLQDTPPAASLPPQDLVLPPPPPVWYPPLYPPYGIDPLHFFIDLRVSGHIYDRKKENVSPLTSAENSNTCTETESPTNTTPGAIAPISSKHRHGSAFTVPTPRSNELKATTADAINLTSSAMANKFENYAKYYDLGESKENQPFTKTHANYMLQHLPRLYSQFAARDFIASNVAAAAAAADMNAANNDNKSEPDCDADSEEQCSTTDADCIGIGGSRERDIDVEMIDSIKYRTDGECSSSRCTSPDEASITQID